METSLGNRGRRMAAALIAAAILLPLMAGPPARAAEPEVRLQVRHLYDGCGSLCYLGALAMAMQDDSLPYLQVVRYTNPALVKNGETVLGQALENLGYAVTISGVKGDRVKELVQMMSPGAQAGTVFQGEAEAVEYIVKLLREGKAPMVTVQQAPLWPDREAAFRQKKNPLPPNPGRGQHYLVVTGVDADRFYVNDPAWKGTAGVDMPIRRPAFLKAWGEEGYVVMTADRDGTAATEDQVFRQALEAARKSPKELEATQVRLESETGTLDISDYLNLSAGAYRRQVLADWLAERGYGEAARAYRRTLPYYRKITPGLSSKAAAEVVGRIQALESEASALLPPQG